MDPDEVSLCHCYNIDGVESCGDNCMNRFVFYEVNSIFTLSIGY